MLSDCLKLLHDLNKRDLEKLKAAIEDKLGKIRDDAPEHLLWGIICKAAGIPALWDHFLNSTEHYPKWKKYVPAIDAFLEAQFPTATKVDHYALMTFIVSALVNDLKGRNVPITIGSIV